MKRRKSGKFTKFILLVLVVYGIASIMGVWRHIEVARENQAAIIAEIERLEQENAALETTLLNLDDERVKEEIARNQLGMTTPGEVTFFNPGSR